MKSRRRVRLVCELVLDVEEGESTEDAARWFIECAQRAGFYLLGPWTAEDTGGSDAEHNSLLGGS